MDRRRSRRRLPSPATSDCDTSSMASTERCSSAASTRASTFQSSGLDSESNDGSTNDDYHDLLSLPSSIGSSSKGGRAKSLEKGTSTDARQLFFESNNDVYFFTNGISALSVYLRVCFGAKISFVDEVQFIGSHVSEHFAS